jgi:hypothetical protein
MENDDPEVYSREGHMPNCKCDFKVSKSRYELDMKMYFMMIYKGKYEKEREEELHHSNRFEANCVNPPPFPVYPKKTKKNKKE